MATRGQIAIKNKNGTIVSIYSHNDNYLSHNGEILMKDYSRKAKISSLIKGGNISSLGTSIAKTRFYSRDMGRTHEASEKFKNEEDWKRYSSFSGVDYNYIYDVAEELWYVFDYRSGKKTLKNALANKLNKGGNVGNGSSSMARHYDVRSPYGTYAKGGKAKQALNVKNGYKKLGNVFSDIEIINGVVVITDENPWNDEHDYTFSWDGYYLTSNTARSNQDWSEKVDAEDVISIIQNGGIPGGDWYAKGGNINKNISMMAKGGKTERKIHVDVDIVEDVLDGTNPSAHSELNKMLNRNGVKMKVITMDGPGGGHPLVDLHGTRSNIKKVLKSDAGWGMEERDAEWYLEENTYNHAKGGDVYTGKDISMMAKGGDVDNKRLIRFTNTDEQMDVLDDIIPLLNEKGIQLRFGTSIGKSPQTILFDRYHQDGLLRINSDGYESKYLPEFDGEEFDSKESLSEIIEAGEYAKGGDVYTGKDISMMARGGKNKRAEYFWIKMRKDKIEEYIDYASRMMGSFDGEIYTQAPNKVAFETDYDLSMFVSMIDNHNEDEDLNEGDKEFIDYEILYGGKAKHNVFDIYGVYSKGGKLIPSLNPTRSDIMKFGDMSDKEADVYIIGLKELQIKELKNKMADIYGLVKEYIAFDGDEELKESILYDIESISENNMFAEGGQTYSGSSLAKAGDTQFTFKGSKQ